MPSIFEYISYWIDLADYKANQSDRRKFAKDPTFFTKRNERLGCAYDIALIGLKVAVVGGITALAIIWIAENAK